MNEQQAQQFVNQRIHEQMGVDDRIPSSLQNRGADAEEYAAANFNAEMEKERPTRDRTATNATQNSNLTGMRDVNFGSRK